MFLLLVCTLVSAGATRAGNYLSSGFYLAFPCSKKESGFRHFSFRGKTLCIVSKPIVTIAELKAISEIDFQPASLAFGFDLYVSGNAVHMLRQVARTSPVIIFMVDGVILFMLDTETTEINEQIRYNHSGDFRMLQKIHSKLKQQIGNGGE